MAGLAFHARPPTREIVIMMHVKPPPKKKKKHCIYSTQMHQHTYTGTSTSPPRRAASPRIPLPVAGLNSPPTKACRLPPPSFPS